MLDLTKPVRTREKSKARLYNADTLDGSDLYPLHGAHEVSPGRWKSEVWTSDGKYSISDSNHPFDLENVSVRKEFDLFVNVYQDGRAYGYWTEEVADNAKGSAIFARVKVHISAEKGEGL